MARILIPTYTTNQLITASHANTYWKDNEAAHWPYTTAGDLAVAASASTLSRIAAPTVGQVLGYLGGTWGAISGAGVQDIQMVNVAPGQDFTNAAYEDITGATVTLTLVSTCTILVLAVCMGYVKGTGSGEFKYLSSVDGTDDSGNILANGFENPQRNQTVSYIHMATGITSGSRIVKLRCAEAVAGVDNHVTYAKLIAIAFTE